VDLGFLWPVFGVSRGLRVVFTVGDFVCYGLRFWCVSPQAVLSCGEVARFGNRRWWCCSGFGAAGDGDGYVLEGVSGAVLVLRFGIVGVGVLVTDLLLFSFAADSIFTFVCFWRL
jgi:hypothetical protein